MSYKTQSALLMRAHQLPGKRVRNSVITVLVCVIAVSVSSAQTPNGSYRNQSLPLKSRAEQAAEQQVALSPEKIIELLRQEPGLLLQVKKVLVRKAYEQGRILDPEDLTDDALFELAS